MTGVEARETRISLKKTQIEVAKEIGISDVSLRYFEQGSRDLKKEHADKLIKFFKEEQEKKV